MSSTTKVDVANTSQLDRTSKPTGLTTAPTVWRHSIRDEEAAQEAGASAHCRSTARADAAWAAVPPALLVLHVWACRCEECKQGYACKARGLCWQKPELGWLGYNHNAPNSTERSVPRCARHRQAHQAAARHSRRAEAGRNSRRASARWTPTPWAAGSQPAAADGRNMLMGLNGQGPSCMAEGP